MSKKIISIIGTTAIGKTRLAIKVAKFYNTEIISCDSRQFFREMKIGVATPDEEDLREIQHHFIGNLSVIQNYSIGSYEEDALKKINELFQIHDVVVLVGGSGMYEKAVTEGLNDLPKANPENQDKLFRIFEEEGIEKLQQMLKDLDIAYFQIADIENPRRLFRAIDVIWQTGEKYSAIISSPKNKRNFQVVRIGIDAPREIIYERINQRVDVMLQKGLLEEAQSLQQYKNYTALNTVGYQELFKYFEGIWDLETAVEEIKKNTRRFAKRQMTWNRKIEDVIWLKYNYSEEDLAQLLNSI